MKRRTRKKFRCEDQARIEFTDKPIPAWGWMAGILSKFLDRIKFREWVESSIPIEERSNNRRGVYEKVLAMFLTVLVGGKRFTHVSWWGHEVEAICAAFGVMWLRGALSALMRFWGKIRVQSASEAIGEPCLAFASQILRWEGILRHHVHQVSRVRGRFPLPVHHCSKDHRSAPVQGLLHDVEFKRLDEGIEVGEFYFKHQDKKWDRPRRYVVVRQKVSKRPKATGKQLKLFEELSD